MTVLSYGDMMAKKAVERREDRNSVIAQSVGKSVSKGRKEPSVHWFNGFVDMMPMLGIEWGKSMPVARDTLPYVKQSPFTILQMPTGTGKTAVAVATMSLLPVDTKIIVVAPRAVVEAGSWEATFMAWNKAHPDHCLEPVMIETHSRFANLLEYPKSRGEILRCLGGSGFIILDEAHAYKTATSKRSKMLQWVRHVPKLGLTATPFTNDVVLDGISYLVINGDYNSKTDFLHKSGLDRLLDKYYQPNVYIDGRVSRDIWAYYDVMCRQLARVVYTPTIDMSDVNMPEVKRTVVTVDTDEELLQRVKSIDKTRRKGGFETSIDMVMALVETVAVSPMRLHKLVELLQAPGVVQPLVFYWNNSVRKVLLDTLIGAGFSPQVLAGDTSFNDLDLMSGEPILVQYQAGAEGVEFKRSNLSVFYQNQSSASCLLQAEGRNVRRGMGHVVKQYWLVSPIQFDEELFHRLTQKIDTSERVLIELAEQTLKGVE